jgi:uncharacterized protein (TIGR00251 family)
MERLFIMDIKKFIKNNHLKIIVKPNSPETKITGYIENKIKLNVHAPPEAGKANREIIKFFAKKYKLKIEIKSGHTSKEKLLKVADD